VPHDENIYYYKYFFLQVINNKVNLRQIDYPNFKKIERKKIMDRLSQLESELSEIKLELKNMKENYEKIIGELTGKLNKSQSLRGFANIYQYKNSLILMSNSKDKGTYEIKEQIKKIGGKWAKLADTDTIKISGWIFPGVCKDSTPEDSIIDIVNKLKDVSVHLDYDYKGVLRLSE
jgi:regulator of replication initiation timing